MRARCPIATLLRGRTRLADTLRRPTWTVYGPTRCTGAHVGARRGEEKVDYGTKKAREDAREEIEGPEERREEHPAPPCHACAARVRDDVQRARPLQRQHNAAALQRRLTLGAVDKRNGCAVYVHVRKGARCVALLADLVVFFTSVDPARRTAGIRCTTAAAACTLYGMALACAVGRAVEPARTVNDQQPHHGRITLLGGTSMDGVLACPYRHRAR